MEKQELISALDNISEIKIYGEVSAIRGNLLEVSGFSRLSSIGSKCIIYKRNGENFLGEVIGFEGASSRVLPYAEIDGVGIGCKVELCEAANLIHPDESWLGRVINALGEPLDNLGPLKIGKASYNLKNTPPPARDRRRVEKVMDMGVKAINCFTTICEGQRLGIFAGSGVGKSVLLSMLTKYAEADVKIIGLVGERGREVKEFLDDYLGDEGLKKAIVVVATSDESALLRRQAAFYATSLAEYFRDQGKSVLLLIDSVTRFAMAQREIGLSGGEPPTTKAYPPSVFSELPKLLERAGPGTETQGSITALYSVLVDGDDHNEPISDTVRGILDGHIVLERGIAERGRFPSVNVLKSVSRTMPRCLEEFEKPIIRDAKKYLALYDDMSEMIRLGAYRKGNNQEVDLAIDFYEKTEKFLSQAPTEHSSRVDAFKELGEIYSKEKKATNP